MCKVFAAEGDLQRASRDAAVMEAKAAVLGLSPPSTDHKAQAGNMPLDGPIPAPVPADTGLSLASQADGMLVDSLDYTSRSYGDVACAVVSAAGM